MSAAGGSPGPLDGLTTWLTEHGAPVPPVPPELAPRLTQRNPATFATRDLGQSPYRLGWFQAEAEAGETGDYLLVGFAGHGLESKALHYYLVHGPLALFIQSLWDSASEPREALAARAAARFAAASRLLDAAERARREGRLGSGVRLVVVVSDFSGEHWKILGQEGGARYGPPGGMAAAEAWLQSL